MFFVLGSGQLNLVELAGEPFVVLLSVLTMVDLSVTVRTQRNDPPGMIRASIGDSADVMGL
ncbi:hypothetical protein GGP65_003281 [Salinibacter ruber]|nr:hypothetical protein [Salinibacter ruber]MCS3665637.1 hypothetical protein [Salinibacter ruber]